MPIATGTRLGPYDIVAPLGAGGMGEVWRARDSRLDRSVAIKILPQAFSADPHRKLRFEREARAISQMNHPHICALYDIGHDSGTDYIVMELIEGDTLAERLNRGGALPLPDVIRYGSQIAEALHTAHRNGIVHRDLKPGNIMLTRTGAKLLDFGLARTCDVASSPDEATAVMKEQKPLTEEGAVVGTFQYMSPEQLGGEEIDQRSDIFALGAVLYEMTTGRRAFGGSTRTSIITSIVSAHPPPISSVQPLTPPALQRLIASCLEKDRDERTQSAHDVALQLRWLDVADQSSAPRLRRQWVPWALAAAFALTTLATVGFYSMRIRNARPAQLLRFTLAPPPQTNFNGIPAVSPDGRRLVLNAQAADGRSMLWLRSLDSLDAQPLKGTENAGHAFWSPDGRQIGFITRNKMWRFDTADGSVHAIHDILDPIPGGATWNRDDVIVFTPTTTGQLYRVSATGGEAVPVAKGPDGESNTWPWFLPDGDHFLFRAMLSKQPGIYVGSLSSNERKRVLTRQIGSIVSGRIAYTSGYIVYNEGPVLYAQKFDVNKLEVVGNPQIVDQEVEFYAPGRSAFSVSPGGTLVYHRASDPTLEQLTFVDRAGKELGKAGPLASYSNFRLSPDDRKLAFMRWGATNASWILDIVRGAVTRISFERFSGFPVWMPDSRTVVYAAAVDRPPNLFVRRENGSTERLTNMARDHYPSDVTPDGKYILTELNNPPNRLDIIAVPVAAPQQPIALVATPFDEREPVISPNGKWLAYESNESGAPQVYATRFLTGGGRVQISPGGGNEPRWSRDGRRLYYVDMTVKKIVEVDIAAEGDDLQPSVARPLFSYGSPDYDVTRDGRFLIATPQLNPDAAPMTVVVNWTSTLK